MKDILVDPLLKAKIFGSNAHGSQKYGDLPYSFHYGKVLEVAIRFGITKLAILEAILTHDVVEDTTTTLEEVKLEFGEEVANLVYCVTDEPGKNRKERKDKTYPKIKATPDAILVKLCDRIANVEFSEGKPIFDMYQKEHKDFSCNLKRPDSEMTDIEINLWKHLDSLLG